MENCQVKEFRTPYKWGASLMVGAYSFKGFSSGVDCPWTMNLKVSVPIADTT